MPECKLHISGFCEDDSIIKEYSSKYNNIIYHGKVEYKEYVQLLETIPFLLSTRDPKATENQCNFPSKIIEALLYNRIIVSTIHYAQLDGIKYFEVSSDVAKFAVDINQILAMSSDNILDFANQSSKVKAKYGVGIWKKQWKLLSKNEKLVLFSNYLNHHQQPLADAFYELLGDSFAFVATMPVDDLELKGGKDYSSREYCVVAAKDCTSKALAMNLARTSEICIFGAQSLDYAIERAKQPNCGLSFEFGERWLKRGWINVLSPHLVNGGLLPEIFQR